MKWSFYGTTVNRQDGKTYYVWHGVLNMDERFQISHSADTPPNGTGGYMSLEAMEKNGHVVTKAKPAVTWKQESHKAGRTLVFLDGNVHQSWPYGELPSTIIDHGWTTRAEAYRLATTLGATFEAV